MLRCKILCLGIFGHEKRIFLVLFSDLSYNTLGCISSHITIFIGLVSIAKHKRSVSIVNTKTNKLIYNRLGSFVVIE